MGHSARRNKIALPQARARKDLDCHLLSSDHAYKTHSLRIHSDILANIHMATTSRCLHIHSGYVQLPDLLLPNGRHFHEQNGNFWRSHQSHIDVSRAAVHRFRSRPRDALYDWICLHWLHFRVHLSTHVLPRKDNILLAQRKMENS